MDDGFGCGLNVSASILDQSYFSEMPTLWALALFLAPTLLASVHWKLPCRLNSGDSSRVIDAANERWVAVPSWTLP